MKPAENALLTTARSGLSAARELLTQGREFAILSPSDRGEALAKALGGLGVSGLNEAEDSLRRLPDCTGYVNSPNIHPDARPARSG